MRRQTLTPTGPHLAALIGAIAGVLVLIVLAPSAAEAIPASIADAAQTHDGDTAENGATAEGDEADAAAAALARCPYLHLCVFSEKNFQGTMHPMKSCTWHEPHFLAASWVNNQTPGTRARFIDHLGQVLYTTPGAYSLNSDSWTIGLYTRYIKPC